MSLGEKGGCDSGVGLGHRVAINHSSDVAGVTWHLLAAHVMSGASYPVLRVLALVAKDVLVHLSTSWEVNMAHHALLESNATQSSLVTS